MKNGENDDAFFLHEVVDPVGKTAQDRSAHLLENDGVGQRKAQQRVDMGGCLFREFNAQPGAPTLVPLEGLVEILESFRPPVHLAPDHVQIIGASSSVREWNPRTRPCLARRDSSPTVFLTTGGPPRARESAQDFEPSFPRFDP